MPPRDYRCYLIDIEGVLVRDKRYEAIPGAHEWFAGLAHRGIQYCLVSNNTTHTPDELRSDLDRAGFPIEPDQLVTALELGVDLLTRWEKRRVLWLGVPRLREYWLDHGFELVETGECDAVILGANAALQVADLNRALTALLDHSAELVALHRNLFFLDKNGKRTLGPGAWCAALEPLSGFGQAVCVGKPSEKIYREALKRVAAVASDALFISDDPQSDLVTAKRLGMGTVFLLCGKYPDHAVLGRMSQEEWPDIICERLSDLDV